MVSLINGFVNHIPGWLHFILVFTFKWYSRNRGFLPPKYTKQPKVFQQPEFPRMPFKASIIQFRSHNYIINCLKISSTVIRVAYHVISGHVRSMNVKWHKCTYHVPLVAQREISLYLS